MTKVAQGCAPPDRIRVAWCERCRTIAAAAGPHESLPANCPQCLAAPIRSVRYQLARRRPQ